MEYLLEFASVALSVSLVGFGLVLLQRSHGIAVLETVPLAVGLALFVLSSLCQQSASTLRAPTLILPIAFCTLFLLVFPPYYSRWRLRVGGEATTLLLSFALMNCCFLLMSTATSGRSVALGLADLRFIETKARLETFVIIIGVVVLGGTVLHLRHRGLTAALQLSKDDHRLLFTFGFTSDQVRKHILVLSSVLCTAGVLLFVSLQESFAPQNSYAVLIPSFAIAISQTRISVPRTVSTAFVLVAAERLLTQLSSEILCEFYQAVLFSLFVLIGVGYRIASDSGAASGWRRYLATPAKGRPC